LFAPSFRRPFHGAEDTVKDETDEQKVMPGCGG
jgi:hypothetical protein